MSAPARKPAPFARSLDRKLAAAMRRIGAERDRLDELLWLYEQLRDDCGDALDELQRARDALSRLV